MQSTRVKFSSFCEGAQYGLKESHGWLISLKEMSDEYRTEISHSDVLRKCRDLPAELHQAGDIREGEGWATTHIRLPFFRDYWEHYDVRHYGLDEVLALLPESSGMAERFKLLKRAHKDIMAGQIALGAVYAHFLVKISKTGSVIKTRTAVKRSRRA